MGQHLKSPAAGQQAPANTLSVLEKTLLPPSERQPRQHKRQLCFEWWDNPRVIIPSPSYISPSRGCALMWIKLKFQALSLQWPIPIPYAQLRIYNIYILLLKGGLLNWVSSGPWKIGLTITIVPLLFFSWRPEPIGNKTWASGLQPQAST